jgi:hypothetical protein
MAIRKSSNTGIPFGNTANRPVNPAIGQPYFNGEEQRLEIYTNLSWQNIVAETPGVVSFTGTVLETNSTNTLVISGTNFANGAVAYLIGSDGTEYAANTTTVNSIVQITAVFPAISASKEPYDIKVVNPSNLYGLLPDAVSINDKPVWQTAAGSLGTFTEQTSISVTVAATDEENNTMSYSLASGSSLPSGITLNSSSGVISGTLPNITANTTYTFTINASDGINSGVPRTFSITSTAAEAPTGGTITTSGSYRYHTFIGNGTFTCYEPTTVEYLIIAGGGSGGNASGNTTGDAGGGGAGGVRSSSINLTAQAYSITVGAGGSSVTSAGTSVVGNRGNNSSAFGLSATAGGRGGADAGNSAAYTGGSGGSGGGGSNGWAGGSGNEGGYSPSEGNNGGFGGPGGSGGGGGAGGAGINGAASESSGTAGGGGIGTNSYSSWLTAIASAMTGVSGWSSATSGGYIAGGGAGGSDLEHPVSQPGGLGGGGAGGARNGDRSGVSGITNTGSGGGATSSADSQNVTSGGGGSGLVVIRYQV